MKERAMKDTVLPTKQSDDFTVVLGNTFKLITFTWKALLLNLVTFLQVYILPLLVIGGSLLILSSIFLGNDGKGISGVTIALGIIAIIGIFILAVLLAIASIITQLASVRGQKISLGEVMDKAQPFFWRFVGLNLATAFLIFLGFILLVIPGVIATVLLIFAAYIMIDKNLGIVDTIKTSVELTKAHWKIALALIFVQAALQILLIIPVIGAAISTGLAIAYFCLPALLYTRIAKTYKKRSA